jgi:simple sugar transport system permease protein
MPDTDNRHPEERSGAAGPRLEGRAAPAPERRSVGQRLYELLLRPEASVIVVSAALILYFQIANANFVTTANVRTLSQFVAAPVIIACGEIMLLICREIDLSVGQVFALAPFLMETSTMPACRSRWRSFWRLRSAH